MVERSHHGLHGNFQCSTWNFHFSSPELMISRHWIFEFFIPYSRSHWSLNSPIYCFGWCIWSCLDSKQQNLSSPNSWYPPRTKMRLTQSFACRKGMWNCSIRVLGTENVVICHTGFLQYRELYPNNLWILTNALSGGDFTARTFWAMGELARGQLLQLDRSEVSSFKWLTRRVSGEQACDCEETCWPLRRWGTGWREAMGFRPLLGKEVTHHDLETLVGRNHHLPLPVPDACPRKPLGY